MDDIDLSMNFFTKAALINSLEEYSCQTWSLLTKNKTETFTDYQALPWPNFHMFLWTTLQGSASCNLALATHWSGEREIGDNFI